MTADRGFSLVELLWSAALTLCMAAGVFSMLSPMHDAFAAEPERADMRQRLRAAADALYRELLVAGPPVIASLPPDLPPIAPYRHGDESADAPGTHRDDLVTITKPSAAPGTGAVIYTFFIATDPVSGIPRLRRARAGGADVPVVDHLVALNFQYFRAGAGALEAIDPARLTDGPWHPSPTAAGRYDIDLLSIRTVRASLRVEAGAEHLRGRGAPLFLRPGTGRGVRLVPDLQAEVLVTLRNAAVLP